MPHSEFGWLHICSPFSKPMIVNKQLRHNNTRSTDFILNCKEIIVYEANHMRELTREILYHIRAFLWFRKNFATHFENSRLVETIVRNYFSFTSIYYLKVY